MTVNGLSTICGVGYWVIYLSQCGNYSYTNLWQPFHFKQCVTHMLPHHETERQRNVNNIWSCILGNEGFVRINEHITELLTACIAKNTT